MQGRDLIYDWNAVGAQTRPAQRIELNDETLRDGLQSPSVTSPTIEQKIEILHHIAALGIDALNIGLPGAGPQVAADVERLAREIVDAKLPVRPNCAARTVIADIEPIVEIAERTGLRIEAATFLGSSPIRRYAEDWDLDRLLRCTEQAVRFVVEHGLDAMYVTEDTTRADPDTLRRLYTTAIECGARRVVVCDTVGHATPDGVRALVRFIRELVAETGEPVAVDWHGHNDRGLGLINAIAAIEAGADRIHGCALGIGERCGNTAMDQLLVNLHLMGWREAQDLTGLPAYCDAVSRYCEVPIPCNYPVVGRDAFETGTGVHAAAVIKAYRKGDAWLANRVYSGVPSDLVGREQAIVVGPMSGRSNVLWALEKAGLPTDAATVDRVFEAAKRSRRNLTPEEVRAIATGASAESAPHFQVT
ncbi:MAG: 2-isopropylmalate synthase [Planctomycetota bacterium]|nr:MAG: 2-isopropylmalate synthase [Planctomycetota bacterium]